MGEHSGIWAEGLSRGPGACGPAVAVGRGGSVFVGACREVVSAVSPERMWVRLGRQTGRLLVPVFGCEVAWERHDRQGARGKIVRGHRWSIYQELLCSIGMVYRGSARLESDCLGLSNERSRQAERV